MMIKLTNQNAVFIHVPKTGGMWVRKVLRLLEIPHEQIGGKHTYDADICRQADSVFSVYRGFRTWSESFWVMKRRGARQTHGTPTYLHKPESHGVPECWPAVVDTHADLTLDHYRDRIFEAYNSLMDYYREAGTLENHKQASYELLVPELADWLNSIGIQVSVEELNTISPVNTRYGT